MRIVFVFVTFLLGMHSLNAQDRLYYQMESAENFSNPALTSLTRSFEVQNAFDIYQFTGDYYPGNNFVVSQYLGNPGTISVSSVTDFIGLTFYQSAGVTYAKSIKIGARYKLGIGIQPTFYYRTIETDLFITPDGTPASNDPSIATIPNEKSGFDLHSGLVFSSEELLVSYGVKHLMRPNSDLSSEVILHNLWIAYKFRSDKDFQITPSIMGMYQGNLGNIIGRVKFKWKSIYTKVGYQIGASPFAGIGFENKRFLVGYGYALTTGLLRKYHSGHHQISLSLKLDLFDKINDDVFRY